MPALTGTRIGEILVVFSLAIILVNLEDFHVLAAVNGNAIDKDENEMPRQFPSSPGYGGGGGGYGGHMGPGRPLCDSSVYSYCSFKMIHDSCCCNYPAAHLKPPQCYYANCALLYSKSCYEHSLIRTCCCNNPYY